MTESLYSMMIELDEFIDAIPEDMVSKEIVSEFDAIMERVENKVDACASYMDFVKGRQEELRIKKERVEKALKAYKSKEKRMQQYLVNCIHLSGEKSIAGKDMKISIRNNPASLNLSFKPESHSYKEVDPMLLPLEMKPFIKEKIIYVMDSKKLKNALQIEPDKYQSAKLERSQSILIKEK